MRKAKYLKAVIAAILIATMLCGSAMAATSGKVITSSMSVYKTKSTRRRIGVVPHGARVKVSNISGNWAKITYKGKSGYAKLGNIMFNKRIKMVSTQKTSIKFMTKKSYRKSVYYTGTLAAGVEVYVVGIKDGNYLFQDKSGSTVGYVRKSAVRKAA